METNQDLSTRSVSVDKVISDQGASGLADYVRIFWKRKIGFALILCVVVIAAIAYNLLIPETFEAKAYIKIGQSAGKEIISLAEMKTLFSAPATLQQVAKALSMPDPINIQSVINLFNLSMDENKSDLILIRGRGQNPEKAVSVANAVIQVMLEQHKKMFDIIEQKEQMEIALLKRDQSKTEQDIIRAQQNLAATNKDIKSYQQEVQKRENAQSDGQGRIVESYLALLGQAKREQQTITDQIAQLQLKQKNYDALFFQKEFEKKLYTTMTQVKIQPTLPTSHISPNRTQNVKLWTLIAFILAVIYVFTAEFISKNKAIFKNNFSIRD